MYVLTIYRCSTRFSCLCLFYRLDDWGGSQTTDVAYRSNHPFATFLPRNLRALAKLCFDPRSFDDSLKRLGDRANARICWPRLGASDKKLVPESLQDVVAEEEKLDDVLRTQHSGRLEGAGEYVALGWNEEGGCEEPTDRAGLRRARARRGRSGRHAGKDLVWRRMQGDRRQTAGPQRYGGRGDLGCRRAFGVWPDDRGWRDGTERRADAADQAGADLRRNVDFGWCNSTRASWRVRFEDLETVAGGVRDRCNGGSKM